jgi:hypothetical protein
MSAEEELKQLLGELIAEISDVAMADASTVGAEIVADFRHYLQRSQNVDDHVAQENLRDLRIQAQHIITKNALHVSHAATEKILKGIEIAAKIALKAMGITLPPIA